MKVDSKLIKNIGIVVNNERHIPIGIHTRDVNVLEDNGGNNSNLRPLLHEDAESNYEGRNVKLNKKPDTSISNGE